MKVSLRSVRHHYFPGHLASRRERYSICSPCCLGDRPCANCRRKPACTFYARSLYRRAGNRISYRCALRRLRADRGDRVRYDVGSSVLNRQLAAAEIPRGNAKKIPECPCGVRGIGESALHRKCGNRNPRQGRLPQQLPEKADTQLEDVAFQRRAAIGKHPVQGPLRNAEVGCNRPGRPGRHDVRPQIGIDQAKQAGTAEPVIAAAHKTQKRRQVGDDVRFVVVRPCRPTASIDLRTKAAIERASTPHRGTGLAHSRSACGSPQQRRRRYRCDQDLGALFRVRQAGPRTGGAHHRARRSPARSFPRSPACTIELRPRRWKSNMNSSEPALLDQFGIAAVAL